MSTVVSADGTVIDYDTYGEGPAVVLVGGMTQFRALDERTTLIARQLADKGYTVVDYDRRGRGRSGDTRPWALDREVEDLGALIRAVGGSAAVYSSSSGATIALPAAAAGLGITALALYEPPFFGNDQQAGHVERLRSLVADGDHDGALRYNFTSVLGMPEDAVAGMARMPMWPLMVSIAPTLVYDMAAVRDVNADTDWRSRWASVTVPAIVYSGDRTFPGMPEAADATAAALPNARREVLPGQDHGPAADAIVPVLARFLSEV